MTETAPSPAAVLSERGPDRRRKLPPILASARDLFLAHGFEGVTMDLVSAQAGVSKATLYAYFSSKEELFSAALAEEFACLNATILAPLESFWGSEERIDLVLGQIVRTFVRMFLSERTVALQRTICATLPRCQEMAKLVFGRGPSDLSRRLAQMLAAAHERGVLDVADPDLAARQFIALARSEFDLVGILMLPRPSPAEIDRSVDGAVDLFMTRYGRREG